MSDVRSLSAGGWLSPVAPATPAEAPRRNNVLLRLFGRAGLRLAGWRVRGVIPPVPRFVAVVAPHTSNWDFVIGVLVMFALDLRIVWLGKDTLFSTPLGPFLRCIGGRPVKRDVQEGSVAEIAATLNRERRFVFALAPEGTRKPVAHWRTGFYRIAEATGAPIMPVWLDWEHREAGLGELMTPTGALESDVARLQALYRPSMARFPANYAVGG